MQVGVSGWKVLDDGRLRVRLKLDWSADPAADNVRRLKRVITGDQPLYPELITKEEERHAGN